MTDLTGLAFLGGGVLYSLVHGWRAAAAQREAKAATAQLGGNLGPRVQQLEKQVAYLAGKLGTKIPGILEGGEDGQPLR